MLGTLTIIAQLAPPPVRHFEVADGFAITLIAILFTVLAGFVSVAWWFHKRSRNPSVRDQVLNELSDEEDTDNEQVPAQPASRHWERQADWWKKP